MSDLTIAQIPSGQSLELVMAVGCLLDAALGGAMMAPGNGIDVAATITTKDGQTELQAVARLRAAAEALSGKELPDLEDELPGTLTLTQLRKTSDGMAFGIGDPDGIAKETAKILIAAFRPALDHHEAINYLEFPAIDHETGDRYALIIVRPDGLTPHEARQNAEREVERLRARLADNGSEAAQFLAERWIRQRQGASERCWGVSSDALALYGAGVLAQWPARSEYPSDPGDLAACQRTYDMAPTEIKERMAPVLQSYREHVRQQWDESIR